jgi:hypothetical protein
MESALAPLLAITAWFLGLSILVQVVQEIWKFSTSSKSRAYEKALADFLGPFVVGRLRQDPRLTIRGPLQFRRVSVAGRVLPMNADDLARSIQRSAPEWQLLIDRALEFEAAVQKGMQKPPSPAFLKVLRSLERQLDETALLAKAEGGMRAATASAGFGDATNVYTFLQQWQVDRGDTFDAAAVRKAFRTEFFPQVDMIERHYDQFLENFGYQYRRRNLRQTLVVAFLVTAALNLPIQEIYKRSVAMAPQEAIALSERAQALYAQAAATPDAQQGQQLRDLGDDALRVAQSNLQVDDFSDPQRLLQRLSDGRLRSPWFLIGCFISTILIAFGAPFWNDISSALLRAARPTRDQQTTSAPDRPVKTELAEL